MRIIEQYGSKKSWLRHHVFLLIYALGGLRAFQRIDWQRVNRLVFVCTGNICRSPYAEEKARTLGIATTSFGLQAGGRFPADPTALRAAKQRHVDISRHKCRSMNHISVDAGDLLLAMEPWQARELRQIAKDTGAQLTLLGLWGREPRPYIADPLGLSHAYFQACFDYIDGAVATLVQQINARA